MARSDRTNVVLRITAGLLVAVIGLVLAAPAVEALRTRYADGVDLAGWVVAGLVNLLIALVWFLANRLGELWVLWLRTWPLLLCAAGLWIVWRALGSSRTTRLERRAPGGAS